MFIPQKIFIFLKTPKNIEIQKFDPQKMDRAYVCMKISEYPPWDSNLLFSPDYDVGSCELYACCRICFIKISPFLAIWSSVSDPDLNHNFC